MRSYKEWQQQHNAQRNEVEMCKQLADAEQQYNLKVRLLKESYEREQRQIEAMYSIPEYIENIGEPDTVVLSDEGAEIGLGTYGQVRDEKTKRWLQGIVGNMYAEHEVIIPIERWSQGCGICRAQERKEREHDWRHCQDTTAVQKVWEWWRRIEGMRFTLLRDRTLELTYCPACCVPIQECNTFELCSDWGVAGIRNRVTKWREGSGEFVCQNKDVLASAAAVMLGMMQDEVQQWAVEVTERQNTNVKGEEDWWHVLGKAWQGGGTPCAWSTMGPGGDVETNLYRMFKVFSGTGMVQLPITKVEEEIMKDEKAKEWIEEEFWSMMLEESSDTESEDTEREIAKNETAE